MKALALHIFTDWFKVYEYTFRGINLSFTFLLPFSRGVYSQRKEFAPLGANSFL